MGLLERCILMAIGGGIGFILGYMVARLRTIDLKVETVKNEIHAVNEAVRKKDNEDGFMRIPLVADFAYLLALILILLGLWQMNEERKDDQKDRENIETLAICNTEYLRAQAQYLAIFLQNPPASREQQEAGFIEYTNLLKAYSDRDASLLDNSTYSNKKSLQKCVESNVVKEIKTK